MKKNVKFLILFIILIILLLIIFLSLKKENSENITNNAIHENVGGENNMNELKINVSINGTNYSTTLEDNDTSREFIKRLPLEIEMNELNGNEKFYYFNDSLPSNSSQIGEIKSGDIMLYGNDCLVIFYETFRTTYNYTRIGKIDDLSDLKEKVGAGSVRIIFSK